MPNAARSGCTRWWHRVWMIRWRSMRDWLTDTVTWRWLRLAAGGLPHTRRRMSGTTRTTVGFRLHAHQTHHHRPRYATGRLRSFGRWAGAKDLVRCIMRSFWQVSVHALSDNTTFNQLIALFTPILSELTPIQWQVREKYTESRNKENEHIRYLRESQFLFAYTMLNCYC